MNSSYKRYYLIDASAYARSVDLEYNIKNHVNHSFFGNISKGYFYYIPQFCIAEVFNVYAKWYYRKNKIDTAEYNRLCSNFKDMIHNRKVFYPYDLHRYHNLRCDEIYEIEQKTNRLKQGKPYLSTFDILIIAMGLELQHIHGKDNVVILSCDERLIKIANLVNVKTEEFK
ncbi:MAG: hypothetical protein LBT79_07050 [Elusimicrobiota bacterium]|jgi:predicted nucleic acid-binding protein|nr:hypothetical protein [Elusimicrobiota bacterium]